MTEAQKALYIVKKALEERKNALQELLSDGKAKDYAEYKEFTGKVFGLTYGIEEIKSLLTQIEQNDE